MKAHDLADQLYKLAALLRRGPNIDLDSDFPSLSITDLRQIPGSPSLDTLSKLTQLKKSELKLIISNYNLPIAVRSRDAARDILGKIATYLETNPQAKNELRKKIHRPQPEVSDELQRALRILIDM